MSLYNELEICTFGTKSGIVFTFKKLIRILNIKLTQVLKEEKIKKCFINFTREQNYF